MVKNVDSVIRRVLWVGAAFNFVAALMLAFPDSIGSLASMPVGGPLFYRWLLVLFVVLFGGTYAWLAVQSTICRPLVGLAAIGKTGVFVVAVVCWLLNDVSTLSLLPAVCDLAFGCAFGWWLLATREVASESLEHRP